MFFFNRILCPIRLYYMKFSRQLIYLPSKFNELNYMKTIEFPRSRVIIAAVTGILPKIWKRPTPMPKVLVLN